MIRGQTHIFPKTTHKPTPVPTPKPTPKHRRCERITVPMCKNLTYSATYMPNLLGHTNQEDAAQEIHQFIPLVNVQCSKYLRFVLCAVYVPGCVAEGEPVSPCRSLCSEARKGCEPVMNKFGFGWPDSMSCERFPESDTCFGESEGDLRNNSPEGQFRPVPASEVKPSTKITGAVLTTTRTTIQRQTTDTPKHILPRDRCEKITVPMCFGLPYNETSLPNVLGHVSQEEAGLEIHQFFPLVEAACSEYLKLFMCLTYLPVCTILDEPIPPCRSLCNEAKSGCEPLMRNFGFQWPDNLNCEKYPVSGLCQGDIALDKQTPNNVKSSTPIAGAANYVSKSKHSTTRPTIPSQTADMPKGIPRPGRCEKITVPMCMGLPYNETALPNLLGHITQDDTAMEIHQFLPLVKIGCSKYLKLFLCLTYLPVCTVLDEPVPPCRSLCNEAKSGCEPLMRNFGFQWPDNLNCEHYPVSGLCQGDVDIDTQSPNNVQSSTLIAWTTNYVSKSKHSTTRPTLPSRTANMPEGIPRPGRCEKITVPMCMGLSYNETALPNLLGHMTQDDAAMEIQQFLPLVETACSKYLKLFLCVTYLPVCTVLEEPIPPCQSLCYQAHTGCLPWLRKFGFEWSHQLKCHQYPVSGLCVREDDITAHNQSF